MKPVPRAWLRFVLLGLLLFGVDLAFGHKAAPLPPLAVGATPSDEELLLARALARGEERRDPVVRRRLAQNMRFALGTSDASEDVLVAQALALGMQRSDLVARRRLAQIVSLEIQGAARHPEPDPTELRAYFEAHAARWTEPARVTLVQIPFASAAAARAALAGLPALPDSSDAGATPAPGARTLPIPRALPPSSQAELVRLLGPAFARGIADLPLRHWSGPVPSAYAQHLVWVVERTPAHLSAFETVQGAVREALLAERSQRALHDTLARWRAEAMGRASNSSATQGPPGARRGSAAS